MKGSKAGILIALSLIVLGTTRVAAGPQSLLDPYASVQPPSSKTKPAKQPSSKADAPKATSARSALTTMSAEEESATTNVGKSLKVKADKQREHEVSQKKEPNEAKVVADKPLKTKSSDGGVLSGIKDIQDSYMKTFKAAGSGFVNGTKAAGSKVADGTKKVGEGISTGAKSSGQCFLKGARVIGHGFKLTGSKVKDGAGKVGSKVAVVPKKANKELSDAGEGVKQAHSGQKLTPQAASEQVLDDASMAGKPLEPLATKPLVKGKSPAGSSIVGRTFGKFNVFGHNNKQALPAPRAAVNQANQSLPN